MLANALGGRSGVGGGRGAGAEGGVNAQRMRALEGQVLQAKMESNESKEDAAKVSFRTIGAASRPNRKRKPNLYTEQTRTPPPHQQYQQQGAESGCT